jgi:hypothetical protein
VRPARSRAFLLTAALLFGAANANAATSALEFVHVAANVDGSSGGHSALRLGDFAYQYEFDANRILKLDRTYWPDFVHHYAGLENRGLRLSRVPLSPAAAARVERRFARLLVVQQRHLDRLDALEQEADWHEARAGVRPDVPVRGAGLFAADGRSLAGLTLIETLEQRLGADFLENQRDDTHVELAVLADTVSATSAAALQADALPDSAQIAAERRRELLERHAALDALLEARPLAAEAVLDVAEVAPEERARALSADERRAILGLLSQVEDSIARLAASQRPDRGLALLITAARYHALRGSLELGRLVLLDSLPAGTVILDADTAARRSDSLARLADEQRRIYLALRAETLGAGATDERGLRLLEQALTRLHQAEGGARLGRSVRGSADPTLLPMREGTLSITPAADAAAASRLARIARLRVDRQHDRMSDVYGYHLIARNCATEVVRATETAFAGPQQARAALGGLVGPGRGLAFIPAGLNRRAERRLAVAEVSEVPSYRRRRLADMTGDGRAPRVKLRESNTLTSQIYTPTDPDGAFLFFTDGSPWLRPILGTLNLAYATLHAAAGVAALPFDAGRRLMLGLHGMTFSVPELFFVNIRKGTFEFVPREDP